jgi:hypothetical protein
MGSTAIGTQASARSTKHKLDDGQPSAVACSVLQRVVAPAKRSQQQWCDAVAAFSKHFSEVQPIANVSDASSRYAQNTRTSSSGCTATCCAPGPWSCPASGVGCSSCAPGHATEQLRTKTSLQHACFGSPLCSMNQTMRVRSPPSSCGQHPPPASARPKSSVTSAHTRACTTHASFHGRCRSHQQALLTVYSSSSLPRSSTIYLWSAHRSAM